MDKNLIGVIGCGNIGGAIISDLATAPYNLEVAMVCVDRIDHPRAFPEVAITNDINLILDNPDINIIIECTTSQEVEDLVVSSTEQSGKKLVHTNKNYWDENDVEYSDWVQKKKLGIETSEKLIQELLQFTNFSLTEES